MRRWDTLVDRYLEEYEAAGRASGTIANVRRELVLFGNWMKRRRPRPKLDAISSDLIVRYLQGRSAFHSKATLSGVLSKLRGMGEFLTDQGVWRSNPFRWMRGPRLDPRRRLPKRIKPAAMAAIWETAATSRFGYHRWLWLAVLGVLYGTGARRGELIRLDSCHWDPQRGELLFDGRKTGRERRVPVPPLTYQCLEAYLPQRQNQLERCGKTEAAALFVNQHGGRLKEGGLSHGMKRLVARAGHGWVTMHKFRHTCASDLLEEGTGLCEVQRLLGHQSIASTVRYLHVADPQLQEAVQVHPINDLLGGKRGS